MTAKKAAAPAGGEAAPKKSKKMLFIIVGVVLALAGGGGYYYMSAKKAAAAAAEEEGGGHAASKEHAKKPIFVPLDAFTVNLADTNAEKMAQISVTLQVSDPKVAEEVKVYMPAIRHNLLKIISSKESKELLSSEGKDRLADEIAIATAIPLGWTPPEDEGDRPPKAAKPAPAAPHGDAKTADAGHGEAKPAAAEPEPAEVKVEKPKPKKLKRRAPPPNPIEQVHFSQFIVQ